MSHAEVRFTCTEVGSQDALEVIATQTHRSGRFDVQSHLEWQFYVESLDLILERRSEEMYVSIDDRTRIFRSRDAKQPPFGKAKETPKTSASRDRESVRK